MFLNSVRAACALLLALSLASCATMTPEQCRLANWHDVGLRDGLEGRPLTLLGARTSDCAENNVRIDQTAYLNGREAGLRSYCQPGNAVQLGLHGGNYEGVCPPQIDGDFRRRFQLGYNVYALHAELGRIDGRIQWLEHRLRTLDRDEDKRLREADKDDERRRIRRETDDERRRVRDELHDLDRHLYHARNELRDAEWQLDQLR